MNVMMMRPLLTLLRLHRGVILVVVPYVIYLHQLCPLFAIVCVWVTTLY